MPNTPRATGSAVVVALAVMFVSVVGASTLIAVAIEDGGRATTLIGLLLGSFATLTVSVITLAKVDTAVTEVKDVKADTSKLTNGHLATQVRNELTTLLEGRLTEDQPPLSTGRRDRTRE